MKTLLKNGTVVCGERSMRGDVLINGEIIEAVGRDLSVCGAHVIDVTGKILLPGFLDAHTHFDLDVCGTTTADDFRSGSRSALLGGTTTVVDFACPNKGESLTYGLNLWHKKAAGAFCDYGFHMTVDDWNDGIRAELPEMFRQGVTSFKMYMTYPAMMVGDRDMFTALKAIGGMGGLTGVHCENAGIIDALIAEAKADGRLDPASHPRCRPPEAEAEAVSRLCRMAQVANVPVMVVHLSCAESLREVAAARARGQKVYAETCPQYLFLDESRYAEEYADAAGCVCAPPLRKKADQEALWQALERGDVQTVSTDHCSFTQAQKLAGRHDFTAIPGGLAGVQTRGILLYQGVRSGRISLETMCRVLAENPAKLYGMYPRKGALRPGSEADIVVLDPEAEGVIRASELSSRSDFTPYEGMHVHGAIRQVWLRGQPAVQDGNVLLEGAGRYIAREKGRL